MKPHRIIISIFIACLASRTDRADEVPGPVELRAILKQRWESLDTLQFRSLEYGYDVRGVPDKTQGMRFDFAYKSGGRWAIHLANFGPGTDEIMYEQLEDGQNQYGINRWPGANAVIESIVVNSQTSTPSHYEGMMCNLLWAMIPGGNPLYTHVGPGSSLRPAEIGGHKTIFLSIQHMGSPARIYIDPVMDWLPRRIEIEKVMDLDVTTFSRNQGRWYPSEGTSVDLARNGRKGGFIVTDFRFNQTIAPAEFDPTRSKLEPGVIINDTRKLVGSVVGGTEARALFERKYGNPTPTVVQHGDPIVAEVDPPSSLRPFTVGVAIVMLLAVTLAAIKRFRGRAEGH